MGFTDFLFLGGELRRVAMNASRTGSSATVYFELPDLRCREIVTFRTSITNKSPASNHVKRGEQIRFVIRNVGTEDHEFPLHRR
jgi:uncharacterized cupredoxin-like copper-binding protein